jgi:hypothetical protein
MLAAGVVLVAVVAAPVVVVGLNVITASSGTLTEPAVPITLTKKA